MNRAEEPKHIITVGHSPDPDDAFMFYAMTHGKIAVGEYEFREKLEGIEELNRRAEAAELDISAVSVHQLFYISGRYRLMPVGASMGDGYGPLVVGRNASFSKGGRVAIPGVRTSAALLFQICFGGDSELVDVPFDRVMERVRTGDCDYGVVIHEGQLTYAEEGVEKVCDLGEWFLEKTGLPTPLGVNVIRRDVVDHESINEYLRRSISWGFEHEAEAAGYAMKYARGLEDERVRKFVRMYVNDFTLDLGERGRAGIRKLFELGAATGLLKGLGGAIEEIFSE